MWYSNFYNTGSGNFTPKIGSYVVKYNLPNKVKINYLVPNKTELIYVKSIPYEIDLIKSASLNVKHVKRVIKIKVT